MGTSRTRDLPVALEGIRRRFEHWRRKRKTRSRIPDALWAAAVRVAGTCGLHRTCKALRLDYYSLKERVEQHSSATPHPADTVAGAAFLEWLPPADHGSAALSVGPCECTLELEEASGAKMRISLKGVQASDLALLCRSLWK